MAFDLKDYIQVNERIEKFYEEHPMGSIQCEIHTLTDKLVVVKAIAYRDPTDTLPCIAHSQLAIPGSTPYTKGSELENAETSAVGRALAMMGFEVKRSIASREEVLKAQNARQTEAPAQPEWKPWLTEILTEEKMKTSDLSKALGVERVTVTAIEEYLTGSEHPPRLSLELLVQKARELNKQ